MKKLVFMFVAMAAVSFASCDGAAKGEAAAADSDSVVVEEAVEEVVDSAVTVDSVATDSVQ